MTRHKSDEAPAADEFADARVLARQEGLLDARLLDEHPRCWPSWARLRYVGDQPVSGPDEVVDPGPRSGS